MKRYAEFLVEAVDAKAAIAKLRALPQWNGSVDIEEILPQEVDNPPAHGWNDITKHRERVGGIKIQNIPVRKLIPTQPYVSAGGVERYMKRPQSQWNDNKEDVLNVLWKAGKFYIGGGHHRAAAAILMGYPTVPAEITELR